MREVLQRDPFVKREYSNLRYAHIKENISTKVYKSKYDNQFLCKHYLKDDIFGIM